MPPWSRRKPVFSIHGPGLLTRCSSKSVWSIGRVMGNSTTSPMKKGSHEHVPPGWGS